MADYALVVGIETYDTPAANPLQGPALDATRFALWLHKSQKVPAKNIILIHNKSDAWKGDFQQTYQNVLDELQASGIEPRGDPSHATISNAWRKELPGGDGGTLWIYWSGHGVTFPSNRDAVLCAGREAGNPSFIYLSEIRDSLRDKLFGAFDNQRLIVDACAEYIDPGDLGINGFRSPDYWEANRSPAPEQIELSAVPMGGKARADQGGNPFTRELLRELESGWPTDLPAFFKSLNDRMAISVPDKAQRPRLRILSPHFEDGLPAGRYAAESGKILQVLGDCGIPFDQYRQPYFETMSRLPNSAQALSASCLTAMIAELLALERNPLYGGLPEALVEFFIRVIRKFGTKSDPLEKWMDEKKITSGARSTIELRLSQESSDLLLTILLQETTISDDGFPCNVQAHLSDANLAGIIDSWKQEIADPAKLEVWARDVLTQAGGWAVRKTTDLSVQVFANPPLLGVPWQYFPVNPDAPEEEKSFFGELYPFVLRSRARYVLPQKFEYLNWQAKSEALRLRLGRAIDFAPAPPWDAQAKFALAKVDGLLFIRDTVTTKLERDAAIYRLWRQALNKGLPLALWRTRPPELTASLTSEEWDDLQANVRKLFDQCSSIGKTSGCFREARSACLWALDVVLFWDDAKSADQLRNAIGNEVTQV